MKTIAGYLRVSEQWLADFRPEPITYDLEWNDDGTSRLVERNPIQGPPIPTRLAIRRALGGHPVGPYRKAPAT